jgi:transcriptional regulator with GAF, ATPase, and Fis domain
MDRIDSSLSPARWLLSLLGVAAVGYAVAVLAVAATTQDPRIRCLLSDIDSTAPEDQISHHAGSAAKVAPTGRGVRILATLRGLQADGRAPLAGDRLLTVARLPIESFTDFTAAIGRLRRMPLPVGSDLGQRPESLSSLGPLLPPVVVRGSIRWVEVRFSPADRPTEVITTWLRLRSLPAPDLALTFIWFACHSLIMALAALAFWNRPFDRPGQLFFAMCSVTLVAFIGGYQWWVIADSPLLTVPFIVSGVLLPAVTLHFFLAYPEPKAILGSRRWVRMLCLYAPPGVVAAVICWMALLTMGTFPLGLSPEELRAWLPHLEQWVYVGFLLAAGYFLAILLALLKSVRSTRNPLLQSQVRGILWAGLLATVPVSYSLYLVWLDRGAFALGRATPPMFVASLLFMLAYGVGMARYKLMLIDELIDQGMRFLAMNVGLSLAFAVTISGIALAGSGAGLGLGSGGVDQNWPRMVVVVCAVLVVLWLRNRIQLWIDRRYFREKYPLDRALGRINQVLGRTVEPELLAERMLIACRESMQVGHAALYLRDPATGDYQLVAVDGLDGGRWNWPTDQELLRALRSDGVRPSDEAAEPDGDSSAHRVLRELDIQLVHSLTGDEGGIGLILLGPKRNGASFSAEDLAFLTAVGQLTGVALHTARMQVTASQLNDELRTKAAKISEQQRLITMMQSELTTRQVPLPVVADADAGRMLIKGSSSPVLALLDTVRKVAATDSTVLVRGESGTGKELLARAIHEHSLRRTGPLVPVHCGALSAGLLESELFGHVKGAFTGATSDRKGRFELADGGTLFLDEIGDISMDVQIKLLRVLQERRFEPVGGTRTLEVNVRLITATHQDLEKLIRQGRFREDLYYRLNVISITSPPLRDREDDVLELAEAFLKEAATRHGKSVVCFDDESLQALRVYRWPGNVRELENVVERAVVLAEGPTVTLRELPVGISGGDLPQGIATTRKKPRRRVRLADDPQRSGGWEESPVARPSPSGPEAEERTIIEEALRRSGGNKAQAARLLGMPRSTLFSKLEKYGLDGGSPPAKG